MALRHRITAAFGVLTLFAAATIPLALHTQQALLHQNERIADLYIYGTRHLAVVATAAEHLRNDVRLLEHAIAVTGTPTRLLALITADLLDHRDALVQAIEERDRYAGTPPDRVEQETLQQFSDAVQTLIRSLDNTTAPVAVTTALQTIRQQADLLEELELQRLDETTAASRGLMDEAARAASDGLQRLLSWLAGLVVVAIAASIAVTRAVVRPLSTLTRQIRRIGSSRRLEPTHALAHRRDEIGLVARRFDEMIVDLRESLVSRDFVTAVLETIPSAVVVRSTEGVVQFANAAARAWFGPELSALPDQFERDDTETECTCADGTLRTLLVHRVTVATPAMTSPVSEVIVATDITVRKELERQQELTVAMLTHDLKTPLTALSGVLSLLRDLFASPSGDQIRLLDAGDRNIERMLALIGKLLDLHRLRQGAAQFDRKRIDCGALVRDVIAQLDPAAREAGVELRADCSDNAVIEADVSRLRQVIENLCSNAIRYAGRGASATIRVRQTDDTVTIEVIDNGPGIPEAVRPTLFQPFAAHVRGAARHPDSTGLGLATARLLVEQMGGRLELAHSGPDGTHFTIRFPRA